MLTGQEQTGLPTYYSTYMDCDGFALINHISFPIMLISSQFSRQFLHNILLRDSESCCCLEKDTLVLCARECVTPTVTPNQLSQQHCPSAWLPLTYLHTIINTAERTTWQSAATTTGSTTQFLRAASFFCSRLPWRQGAIQCWAVRRANFVCYRTVAGSNVLHVM